MRVDASIRRTGWVTERRRCPVHGDALELAFSEADYAEVPRGPNFPTSYPAHAHDDNRVLWRCQKCAGSWTENNFLYGSATAAGERFLLQCPRCQCWRVTHTCLPECCDDHQCLDCDAVLRTEVSVTDEPRQPIEPRKGVRRYGGISVSATPVARSGWTREFRRCPNHGEALELVFGDPFADDPDAHLLPVESRAEPALAWWCQPCKRWWTELFFRPARLAFLAEATPAVLCPECKTHDIGARGAARWCRDCGLSLSIRAFEAPDRTPKRWPAQPAK
jgi:hypothetical protein